MTSKIIRRKACIQRKMTLNHFQRYNMFNRSNLTYTPFSRETENCPFNWEKKGHEGHCGEWIKWVDGKLIE